MSRRKKRFKEHAEKREGHFYTALPHVVLWSLELASLSASATKLLFDLLAQYKGDNNGNLCAAWSVMEVSGTLPGNKDWRGRGWRSRDTLGKALSELLETGFIVVTRKGMAGSEAKGKNRVATLYGVTFYAIDYCNGKLDIQAPTRAFMGTWHRQANAQSVTRQAGQSSADCHAGRVNSPPGAQDSHGRRVIQDPSTATINTPGVSPSRGSTPGMGKAQRNAQGSAGVALPVSGSGSTNRCLAMPPPWEAQAEPPATPLDGAASTGPRQRSPAELAYRALILTFGYSTHSMNAVPAALRIGGPKTLAQALRDYEAAGRPQDVDLRDWIRNRCRELRALGDPNRSATCRGR